MGALAAALIAFSALEHVAFMLMEMFFWTTPFVMERFGTTPEFARQSAVLAANQGLYNGILAAGLLWGLVSQRNDVRIFFLAAVIVAGLYGAWSVKPTIFWVQAFPALLALGAQITHTRPG